MVKFFVVILLTVHILACMWITFATIDTNSNWLKSKFGDEKVSNNLAYTMSFYFVLTTVTTVGYGDISATNYAERIFCIFLLFVGVITFAYASGQMASILTSQDL